jgi:hypothetical protein
MIRVLLALTLVACGSKSSSTAESGSGSGSTTAPAPLPPPPKPAPPPASPTDVGRAAPPEAVRSTIDPRLTELFNAAKDCKWSTEGVLQSCPAHDAMHKLAFENQNDDKLAAACFAAVSEKATPTRILAAWCLQGINAIAKRTLFPQALDLIEAEKDTAVRNALAFAMDDAPPELQPRVIALARKLGADPAGDFTASCLLDMLFPQYLMGSAKAPSKEAGDLALEMMKKHGTRQQVRALEVAGLLKERVPEVCAAYGEVLATSGADWAKPVYELAARKDACPDQVQPAVDAMIKAMTANKYNTYEYQATERMLNYVPLSPAQRAKLVPACDKLAAKAEGVFKDWAKKLAALCRKK